MTDLTNAYYLRLAVVGQVAREHRVFSSDEAVAVWCDYRNTLGFGASEMKKGCGDVTDSKGCVVGRISYNGRVWDASGKSVDGLVGRQWLAGLAL
jgi:hypothetical protein